MLRFWNALLSFIREKDEELTKEINAMRPNDDERAELVRAQRAGFLN